MSTILKITLLIFSAFLSIHSEAIYCNPGEYLTSSNKCALCPAGCLFCEEITGICTYCSGLIPAWTNPGVTTPGCTCPSSQSLAYNTSSSTFQCMSGTSANMYYNDSIISAMTTNLTDANILYLKGAAFGVNGNNATAKLLKIVNVLDQAQDVLTASPVNLMEVAWTIIGVIYNQNANTYEILYKLVYFANKIQAATSINEEFTQYFTEFHGLLIAKLNTAIDYTNVTIRSQQILRKQIQATFDNFKAVFLKFHDLSIYNEYIYHYTNLYIRIMKVTDYVYSKLLIDNYRFEGTKKLLENFPKNQTVYFIHVVEQINPFSNVSSTTINPPYSYIQDVQFFIGANYTNGMQYLGNVVYQAGLYYPFSNQEKTQLLYWNDNSYSWKYSLANCGKKIEANKTEIYCYPDSLLKGTLYGIESNSNSY